jgi:ribosomal protein S18 acetylase RimI-like enzyme
MDDRFRMELYRRSDRERVFDLIRAVHPNVASVLIRNWDWKYDNNPFNREGAGYRRAHHDELLTYLRTTQSADRLDSFARRWGLSKREDLAAQRDDEPYVVLIKKDRDEVVGMVGSIAQLFVINGEEHWTSAECDQATHPAYRNRGLSRILANRIRTDHSVSFSWYTEETQKRVTKRFRARARIAGTSHSREAAAVRMVPWVKPLDWSVMATRLTGSRALGGAAALLAAPTRLLGWAVNRPIVVPNVRVLRIASFDEGTDQLCRRASRDYAVMALRDQRYLNWRFVSRPDAPYIRIAAIRDSSTLGYLVFRVGFQV